MGRGGYRIGSGNKPKWKSGKTKTIRVPEAIADEVMSIALDLDQGKSVVTLRNNEKVVNIENITQSENVDVVDLSGISLTHSGGEVAIKLTDLVKKGYKILPKKLSELVNARLSRLNI